MMLEILNAILEQLNSTLAPATLGDRAVVLLTDVMSGLIVFVLYLLVWFMLRALL
jgi:hypothetical protein